MAKLRDMFLAYCEGYAYGQPREAPLNARTLGRYLRGLELVEKLIGHDLDTVSEEDQLFYMEKIGKYAQGTRRVSTQIFQRFIAWGIKNQYLTCENLIVGKEHLIIGEDTPPKYKRIAKSRINRFFSKLKTPEFRILFGLIYYGGLTTSEVVYVHKENVTKHGVFIYRAVRKESQVLPLPPAFLRELQAYAETKEDKLLDLDDNYQSRLKINMMFTIAQVETGELMGLSVRDLRTSGIRHFFELSNDLSLTKAFAGVSEKKSGWLDKLVEPDSYHMKNIAHARRYYGNSTEVWASEKLPNGEER